MSEPLTMPCWEDLAKEAGVRLPHSTTKLSTGAVVKFLHKLGLSPKDFVQWMGFSSMREVVEQNSWSTAREFCGVVLEYHQGLKRSQKVSVLPKKCHLEAS